MTKVNRSNKISLIESEAILRCSDGNMKYLLCHTEGPIDIALKRFEQHPSILKIRNNVSVASFSFKTVVLEIKSLNSTKASVHNNIPVKKLQAKLGS